MVFGGFFRFVKVLVFKKMHYPLNIMILLLILTELAFLLEHNGFFVRGREPDVLSLINWDLLFYFDLLGKISRLLFVKIDLSFKMG